MVLYSLGLLTLVNGVLSSQPTCTYSVPVEYWSVDSPHLLMNGVLLYQPTPPDRPVVWSTDGSSPYVFVHNTLHMEYMP